MADSKISALSNATTPLAGTETLPIVQSSTTKKVAVSDLTSGRAVAVGSLQSNTGGTTYSPYATGHFQAGVAIAADTTNGGTLIGATTTGTELAYLSLGRNYNLSNTGEIALATDTAKKVIIGTNNVARLTAETSGDVTVNTGNLVIGTSGKGIDFSATPQPAGMTSELLADYEEGTWTPTVAAITGSYTTVTNQAGTYTKVGRQVTVTGYFIVSNKGTGSSGASITNLPYAMNGDRYSGNGYDTSTATSTVAYVNTSTTTIQIYKYDGTDPIVVNRGNIFELTYFV